MRCRKSDVESQPSLGQDIPSAWLNWTLGELQAEYINRPDTLYSYVVATVSDQEGRFVQNGSAPNFDYGLITLCTCKHFMRTFFDVESWRGKWVAGFTRSRKPWLHNNLVYLMRIGLAFDNHQALWNSKSIRRATKLSKAANQHPRGDLFQPKKPCDYPYRPTCYEPPIHGHSHKPKQGWHKDIRYRSALGKRAALLVGDPDCSFVWTGPLIFSRAQLARGQKRWMLGEFLCQLREHS